jgi:hypothetical protein
MKKYDLFVNGMIADENKPMSFVLESIRIVKKQNPEIDEFLIKEHLATPEEE